MNTLLVALSHPDDEVGFAGTIAAHRAHGHRVVLLWVSRGEMSEALGPLSQAEVAERRMQQGDEAARILDCEPRFLDLPDTRIRPSSEAAYAVARVIAEVGPSAVLTWGEDWVRGPRHPDHQATGQIVREAITLARIAKVVTPLPPHREAAPVFTLRGEHSALPTAAIDVTPHLETVLRLGRYYRDAIGWPEEDFLLRRLRRAGAVWGVRAAELFDAWETRPGLRATLI